MESIFKEVAYLFRSMTIMDLKFNVLWISSAFGPSMGISFGIPFAFSRKPFERIFGFLLIPFGIIGIAGMFSMFSIQSKHPIAAIVYMALLFFCAIWNVLIGFYLLRSKHVSNGAWYRKLFPVLSRVIIFLIVPLFQVAFYLTIGSIG